MFNNFYNIKITQIIKIKASFRNFFLYNKILGGVSKIKNFKLENTRSIYLEKNRYISILVVFKETNIRIFIRKVGRGGAPAKRSNTRGETFW
jgi:hypothetical protein